jgi:hypothetical protein
MSKTAAASGPAAAYVCTALTYNPEKLAGSKPEALLVSLWGTG